MLSVLFHASVDTHGTPAPRDTQHSSRTSSRLNRLQVPPFLVITSIPGTVGQARWRPKLDNGGQLPRVTHRQTTLNSTGGHFGLSAAPWPGAGESRTVSRRGRSRWSPGQNRDTTRGACARYIVVCRVHHNRRLHTPVNSVGIQVRSRAADPARERKSSGHSRAAALTSGHYSLYYCTMRRRR